MKKDSYFIPKKVFLVRMYGLFNNYTTDFLRSLYDVLGIIIRNRLIDGNALEDALNSSTGIIEIERCNFKRRFIYERKNNSIYKR